MFQALRVFSVLVLVTFAGYCFFCANFRAIKREYSFSSAELVKLCVVGNMAQHIKSILGPPRTNLKAPSFTGFPTEVSKADEVWMYDIGFDGYSRCVVLCFNKGLCTSSHYLDDGLYLRYQHSLAQSIIRFVSNGVNEHELLERYKGVCIVRSPVDSTSSKQNLDLVLGSGVTVRVTTDHGACVDADLYLAFH